MNPVVDSSFPTTTFSESTTSISNSNSKMTKPQLVLRRSLEERRQLLQKHSSCKGNRMAEIVGGTTAELAAVCCCIPCALVDFMVLTMYKVPTGLYRNAKRRTRRRRLMVHRRECSGAAADDDNELSMHPAVIAASEQLMVAETDKKVAELENEMWEKFSEAGFWRSPSRKKNDL